MTKIPFWLLNLPAGTYSLDDLVKVSGKQKPSVHRTIKRLKLVRTFGEIKGNFVTIRYVWPGI